LPTGGGRAGRRHRPETRPEPPQTSSPARPVGANPVPGRRSRPVRAAPP